jgi:3-methyladenine DNA glycosylase AlkD
MPVKKSQIEKFREAARELEADQSEEAFEAVVAKVAKAPKLSDDDIKRLAKEYREQTRR